MAYKELKDRVLHIKISDTDNYKLQKISESLKFNKSKTIRYLIHCYYVENFTQNYEKKV
jgi:hypothetical protein